VTAPDRTGLLARLVDSSRFNGAIAGVIVANAAVLGLETYPAFASEQAEVLSRFNAAFYVVFLIELILRLVSYGRKPGDFFRSGWNVFDFIIIVAVLIPGIREQAQLLRLLRLARVVRLVRFLPDARLLVLTIVKSVPSLFSMVVLIVLLLFVYGMVGWSLFGAALPDTWGTIGRSMLTLFILLTLENFPTYLNEAEPVSPLAVPFFLSYILVAAFLVFNLLIGIVIGSMEKARAQFAEDDMADLAASSVVSSAEASPKPISHDGDVAARIAAIREALDELETEVKRTTP